MRARNSSGTLVVLLLVLLLLAIAGAFGLWRAGLRAQGDRQDPLETRVAALETRVAARDAAGWAAPLADLQHALDRLQQDVDALRSQVAESQASAPPAPPMAVTPAPTPHSVDTPAEIRLQVPIQTQSYNLSCEASAASMAANYLGIPLTEADVLSALPRHENPHVGFRGSLDGPHGGLDDYGVYADPVAAVLEAAGLRAAPVTGGLDGIRQAVARGHPVLAWITYDTWAQTPVEVVLSTGDAVTLVNYEHVVVVTGYDQAGVWVNDPYDGQQEYYPSADMARALSYLGNMALEVSTDGQP
jgi:uncharacterized protein YvpB/uncharacterized coiled-coil protein SlyX